MFEFARWLIFLNLLNFFLLCSFVLLPQYLYSKNLSTELIGIDEAKISKDNIINEYDFAFTNNSCSERLQNLSNPTYLQDNFYNLTAKCCGIKYRKQIIEIKSNETFIDLLLDIVKGTVRNGHLF